jgi:hypothetical protein
MFAQTDLIVTWHSIVIAGLRTPMIRQTPDVQARAPVAVERVEQIEHA